MKFLFASIAFLLLSVANAQSYVYIYHDKPDVINKITTIVDSSGERGFLKVTINSTNASKFKQYGSKNLVKLYTMLSGENTRLWQYAYTVTNISWQEIKKIEFRLINDLGGLDGDKKTFCKSFKRGKYIAWPCASNITNQNLGYIKIGESYPVIYGFSRMEQTILHELSHSQSLDSKDGNDSRYGIGGRPVAIAYGGESSHFSFELQGHQQQPMDEGIGNYWKGYYDSTYWINSVNDFNSNLSFFLGSHSNLTGTAEMWNSKHIVLVDQTVPNVLPINTSPIIKVNGYTLELNSDNLTPGKSRYEARLYKFLDIPGKYVFNAEIMTELYLHFMEKYSFDNTVIAGNKKREFLEYYAKGTSFQKHRYPFQMASFFANKMEEYMKAGKLPKLNTSSLFPIALYDALTHFSISDQEFQNQFEIASYNIEGVAKLGVPKAFAIYMPMRQTYKAALCPYLGGDSSCKANTNKINIIQLCFQLKKLCQETKQMNDIIKLL